MLAGQIVRRLHQPSAPFPPGGRQYFFFFKKNKTKKKQVNFFFFWWKSLPKFRSSLTPHSFLLPCLACCVIGNRPCLHVSSFLFHFHSFCACTIASSLLALEQRGCFFFLAQFNMIVAWRSWHGDILCHVAAPSRCVCVGPVLSLWFFLCLLSVTDNNQSVIFY